MAGYSTCRRALLCMQYDLLPSHCCEASLRTHGEHGSFRYCGERASSFRRFQRMSREMLCERQEHPVWFGCSRFSFHLLCSPDFFSSPCLFQLLAAAATRSSRPRSTSYRLSSISKSKRFFTTLRSSLALCVAGVHQGTTHPSSARSVPLGWTTGLLAVSRLTGQAATTCP